MKNTYYVYTHVKPGTLETYYVGKGKGDRAYCFKRSYNPHWTNMFSKYGCEVRILADKLTEEQAFELEELVIESYGLENLTNMTKGGEGFSGYVMPQEVVEKRTDTRKGYRHSSATKLKIGKGNKGKIRSYETRNKISKTLSRPRPNRRRPILQYDLQGNLVKRWEGQTLASIELGVSQSNIHCALNGVTKTCKGFVWKYE